MKERPGASQTAPSGAFFSTGRGAAASPAHFRPPPSVYWGAKARLPPRCLFFCPRWGRGEGGGCTATPPSPPSPLFIGVQNTAVAPLPAPFAASQKKWGERPCHLPLFRRFLSIGVQERDCCPVALPFVCTAEGGRCNLLLSACRPLPIWVQRRDCCPRPFLCPHWWKGSGCVVCPFLRAAPLLFGAKARLLPCCPLFCPRGERGSERIVSPFPPAVPCLLEAETRLPPHSPLLCPHRRRESSCAAVLSAYLSPCPLK